MAFLRRIAGPRRRRISALSLRIVFFNAGALAILITGMLLVQSTRQGLVDERLAGIRQVASIIASTLAEYTTQEKTRSISVDEAAPLLRQLLAPTSLRARLYGADGHLELDSRDLLARNVVETSDLPPLDFAHQFKAWLQRMYDGIMGVRPFSTMEPYVEAGGNGRVYAEVRRALQGEPATDRRLDRQNKLVLSVAVPVERFQTIYGVLMVTTEGGDIDDILREERASLIGISLVALIVMVISSLYLSGTIAQPVRALAAAADRVRSGRMGREPIPLMAERNDEIGDLADSLSTMTRALYARIDAIESFAADVAHELKNPLTSLRSAIEMLQRAGDDESRKRLMAIVASDIARIDRLITDISDASRLDAELSREQIRPVDLVHLLRVVVDVYQLAPLPRGVKLDLSLALPQHAFVLGQDERLGRIFRNLIDNAVSFSPKGGTVAISAESRDGRVRVSVEDEGPGVPPENLETIFNRFYTERPQDHGFGRNSGLGLSIARQIAEGLGGRIWAENRLGRSGARFLVELPRMEEG
ncbi:MAG TPA: stimulus-sensing domain-containing protein [Rhizomicrobium sp.]|jgi:two-component system sensor histidine kinase ChvG|nr:stimulus-sensing domain-containing protein [Rhizomicrobium sp.]